MCGHLIISHFDDQRSMIGLHYARSVKLEYQIDFGLIKNSNSMSMCVEVILSKV